MTNSNDEYLSTIGGADLYRKVAVVHAVLAKEDGMIETLEGTMEYQKDQHYIVSDDPPTHIWPVRRDIFEATYARIEGSD
jgi:hypothetical protein